jgi:DNA repair exonuclease SbcCD ATPase subunit
MSIFADNEWDTGLTLTVILAPLCLLFFGLWLASFGRVKELKHDTEAAIAKAVKIENQAAQHRVEFEKRIAAISADKDAEIKRHQDDIVKLHKDLETLPTLRASLKEQNQLEVRIRQLENKNNDLEAQLRGRLLGW